MKTFLFLLIILPLTSTLAFADAGDISAKELRDAKVAEPNENRIGDKRGVQKLIQTVSQGTPGQKASADSAFVKKIKRSNLTSSPQAGPAKDQVNPSHSTDQ